MNRQLLQQLQEDIRKINEHPLFKDIHQEDPADVEAKSKFSGHQAAFNLDACQRALTSHGKYKCGANVFWINHLWTATPGIPLNPSSIERFISHYFENPGPVPMDLIIAVPSPKFAPHENKGGLQCVSPDEVRMAYFRSIAKAVQEWNDASASGLTLAAKGALAEKVKQWKQHSLCCTFEFRVLGSTDDIYFTAVNQREKLVVDYHTLAVSAYQRIFQVLSVKARKEEIMGPLTVAKLVEEFNKRAHLAADSEPVTVDNVNAMLQIHQHALKSPAIVAVIEQCERRFLLKSPFNSITKLHLIVRNAKGLHPWHRLPSFLVVAFSGAQSQATTLR